MALFFHIQGFAQVRTYEFEDNTRVDVEVVSVDPDKGRHASIFIGFFGLEGTQLNYLGANYYKPEKFYINGLLGPKGGTIDGNIFFVNKLKKAKFRQSVHGNSSVSYVISIPGEKRKSLGLHLGSHYITYDVPPEKTINSELTQTKRAINLITGLSLLGAKHTHWKIFNQRKEAQGTSLFRINLDFLYYLNQADIVKKNYDFNNPYTTMGSKNFNSVGGKIYVDGKTTIWSRKGRVCINYMLGAGVNTNLAKFKYFFAGLGFGYSFL